MGQPSADDRTRNGFRQKLMDTKYRRNFIHSLVLFFSFICLGVRKAQHSPAFLDLAQITGTNVEQSSIFYTAMSVGALVGTFCMGFLFDKLTGYRYYLLATSCILGAVATAAIPWSTNYELTIFIFFINAVFEGGFDTGGNMSLISIWGVDGKMFMQFLHFSFSLGTIVSPIIIQPFLSRLNSDNSTYCQHQSVSPYTNPSHHYNSPNDSYVYLSNRTLTDTFNTSAVPDECILSESRIHYAYLISGVLCLISGVILAIEGCMSQTKVKKRLKPDGDHRNPRVLPTWLKGLVLGLIAAMYFFHRGSIYTVVGYIMAFCVEGLGWSKDQGTRLNSLFWAGFAASRLLGVFIIKYLSPSKMMFFSNSVVVSSLGGLWLSVFLDTYWGVWLCILFSAVGFAVIFPTGIIYLENDVMKVTGRVTSVIWIAANAQGIVNPPLLGHLMQEMSSMWYIYLNFIEGTLCFVFYGILVLVVNTLVLKTDSLEMTICEVEDEVQRKSFQESDF